MSFFQLYRVALLISGSLIALGGTTIGQAVRKTKPYKKMPSNSITQVYWDIVSQTYVRGPLPSQCNITGGDFNNSDIFRTGPADGWLSTDTGGAVCRWFSNAAKGAAAKQTPNNPTDLMEGIVFSYCSNARDVNWGGQGGSVTLGFYEGYTVYGGAPSTVVAVMSLTGLPANTSDGSFFLGGAGCYEMNYHFPTPIAFADSEFIGYSWQFDDIGSDGTFGNTYPFLSCVVSCNGLDFVTAGNGGGIGGNSLGLGEDGQGMLDVIDQYCTSPFVSSTFTFDNTPWGTQTRTSINMIINEYFTPPVPATKSNYNSVPPNIPILTTTNMVIGKPWTATIAVGGFPAIGGTFQVALCNNPTLGSSLNFHDGLLLVDLTPLPIPTPLVSGNHNGVTGSATIQIPCDLSLIGHQWASQARTRYEMWVLLGTKWVKLTSKWSLSSAVMGQIGS